MNKIVEKVKNAFLIERPPVVAVMGHVDHGKSTLLDYIRKTNVAGEEAGGITQRVSAYEITQKDESGKEKKIVFLDTPGHRAFTEMRAKSAEIADIAILIIAADDSIQPQTLEALDTIKKNNVPYIVAINKTDKSEANVDKIKKGLLEHEIYLEGMGGQVPYVEISAKTGDGIPELLELILLTAEIEEIKGDKDKMAEGFILESDVDPRRGISATLIIKDGKLKKGMFVVSGSAICPVQIMEDFRGESLEEASFTAVRLAGFDKLPETGSPFEAFESKKGAQNKVDEFKKVEKISKEIPVELEEETKIVPIIIKADSFGVIEAIEREIKRLGDESIQPKIVHKKVGDPTMSDIQLATLPGTIILGFNVSPKEDITSLAERSGIILKNFNVIYELTDWLKEEFERRRPKKEVFETKGKTKVLKIFSRTKDKQVVGGRVLEGKMILNKNVRILRRDHEIGQGKIRNLEQSKVKMKEVEEGAEFGMLVESKTEIAPGDIVETFVIEYK